MTKIIATIALVIFMLPFLVQGLVSIYLLAKYPFMSGHEKREAEPMIPYAMITIGVIALGIWMGMD